MRVAIFSDVHGNLTALQAVLEQIETEEEVDQIIFAGDIALFGPRPAECIAEIRQREIGAVYGNTDEWIPQPPPIGEAMDDAQRQRWQHIHALCAWTREQLSEMDLAWLRVLPFHRRVSPTANPRDDLLIVHANPLDVNQLIFPPEAEQKEYYGQIRQSDQDLAPLLQETMGGLIAFGHLHIPSVRRWRDLTLVNVSSVSMPGDGDPRAKYALLSWQPDAGWSVVHRRVSYPVEAEIAAFQERQPPGWAGSAQQLEAEGLIPQKV